MNSRYYSGLVDKHSTELAAADMTEQCTHEHWVGMGWRHGKRRIRCVRCRKSETVGGRILGLLALVTIIAPLYRAGLSLRQATKRTGFSKDTIQKIYRVCREYIPVVLCGCGEDNRHRGWCGFRTAQSPARRAFVLRMAQDGGLRKMRSGVTSP